MKNKGLYFLIIITLLGVIGAKAQDTIAMWTFSKNSLLCEKGLPANMIKSVNAIGVRDQDTVFVTNGKAASRGWLSIWKDKYWLVEFSCGEYKDFHISAKLASDSIKPGPRDFVMQYKTNCCEDWNMIDSAEFIIDKITRTVSKNILLPSNIFDFTDLSIRWLVTSDTNTNGQKLDSNGIAYIDDIIITAQKVNSVNELSKQINMIYPNPATDELKVDKVYKVESYRIFNIMGQTIEGLSPLEKIKGIYSINISKLTKGIYIIELITLSGVVRSKFVKE